MLKTLNEEAQASVVVPTPTPTIAEEQEEGELQVPQAMPTIKLTAPPPCSPRPPAAIFKPREQLMLRANSLKKAIRQIIEHTEKGIHTHTHTVHAIHTHYTLMPIDRTPFSFCHTAVDEQNAQTEEVFGAASPQEEVEEEEEDQEDQESLRSYSTRSWHLRRGIRSYPLFHMCYTNSATAYTLPRSSAWFVSCLSLTLSQCVRRRVRSSSLKAAYQWAALRRFLLRQEVKKTC